MASITYQICMNLFRGKDINDLTGASACATGYHVYHSLKCAKMPEIPKAIETGMFGHVRAYAFSSAKAFLNDFDIKSNGFILGCGKLDLPRDSSHLGFLTNSPDQAISTFHSHGNSSHDPLT